MFYVNKLISIINRFGNRFDSAEGASIFSPVWFLKLSDFLFYNVKTQRVASQVLETRCKPVLFGIKLPRVCFRISERGCFSRCSHKVKGDTKKNMAGVACIW